MAGYLGIAGLGFFGLSLFVLARADHWSRGRAALLLVMTFGVPFVVVLLSPSWPLPAIVVEVLLAGCTLAPFVVLFALSKSVAGRLQRQEAI